MVTEAEPYGDAAVASASSDRVVPGPAGEVDAPPEEAQTVDDFDLSDLDDLVEAPSHAHDIEQKIKATFPGAQLTVLPEPTGDDTGAEAQRPSG